MHLLTSLSNLVYSNSNSTEPSMRKPLALITLLSITLAGCLNGMPVGYNPCTTYADGSSSCDEDTAKPDNNGSGDGEYSCEELTQLAVVACNGQILSIDCANNAFSCMQDEGGGGSGSSSSSTVTIVITVSADGSVSASDDDPSTADCEDGIDNDFDGLADHPDDPGCSSPSDTSEVDSSGGGDTGDGDCVVTAGGIEFCDNLDNDCNGIVDDGDFDGDGYISEDCADTYDGPNPELATDCNDSGAYQGWIHSALIHPNQVELADWIDQDCNGYDEDFSTVAEVEYDGCMLQCNSDASTPVREFFETDGDSGLECISAFLMADESGDANPLDETVSFEYGGTTYSGVAVTCEESESVQGNPALWSSISDIQDEMCDRTPALGLSECLSLF